MTILYQSTPVTKADVVRCRRRVGEEQWDLASLYKCPGIPNPVWGTTDTYILFHCDPDSIGEIEACLPACEEFSSVLEVQRAGWVLETDSTT